MHRSATAPSTNSVQAPTLEVVVEIPRGSFLKRGSTGQLDFLSPLPCPFNYGSVDRLVGLDDDLLDAVILGPRLRRGSRVSVKAYGAVGLFDRGMYDDKLICSARPLSRLQRRLVLLFFVLYAKGKRLLNLARQRPGRCASAGWGEAHAALARARPREQTDWRGPTVPF
jgi:inorganic pyrophosphatase